MTPSPELEASFERMASDLRLLAAWTDSLHISMKTLHVIVSLLAGVDLPSDWRSQVDEAVTQSKQLMPQVLQRHNDHMQALFQDAKRGSAIKAAASEAGRTTKQKVLASRAGQWQSWEIEAKKIWTQEHPKWGARAVARLVAERCGGKVETIYKHIRPLNPRKRSG